jgi:hypothetical protein
LTVFRVTGAILKMGHGQVRCGKCRTQFDALESLIDDDSGDADQDAPAPTAQTASRQSSAIEAHEPDSAEEIIMEGSRIEISGKYRVPINDPADQSDSHDDQFIHEHVVIDRQPVADSLADMRGGSNERETDEADSLRDVPDDQIIEVSFDDGEPVADAAQHLISNRKDRGAALGETPPLSQRIWKRTRNAGANQHTDDITAELTALTKPPQPVVERSGWWTAASVILVVMLVAQIIHHYRDPLVRSPKWGGTVSRLYRMLGVHLTPRWDLHAYELQQWGVTSDGSARDALRVRASVTNTATFEQPYPLVKLALEDRWGSIVAMREFSPEEYLLSTANANRMMAPRQRANAEIVIVDPGADAVGFQIRACMQQGSGIVCSDDVPVAQ